MGIISYCIIFVEDLEGAEFIADDFLISGFSESDE